MEICLKFNVYFDVFFLFNSPIGTKPWLHKNGYWLFDDETVHFCFDVRQTIIYPHFFSDCQRLIHIACELSLHDPCCRKKMFMRKYFAKEVSLNLFSTLGVLSKQAKCFKKEGANVHQSGIANDLDE